MGRAAADTPTAEGVDANLIKFKGLPAEGTTGAEGEVRSAHILRGVRWHTTGLEEEGSEVPGTCPLG